MSNQDNSMENKNSLKMWASLIAYAVIGLLLGYGIAKGVLYLYKGQDAKDKSSEVIDDGKNQGDNKTNDKTLEEVDGYKVYNGSYSSIFEGENKGEVSFLVNEKYTVDQGAGSKNKYFYVKDENGNVVANLYASYEGGRGYTPADYINSVIAKAPNVKLTAETKDVAYGNNVFSSNTNGNSIWNTISNQNKDWVMVIESKVANQEKIKSVFESLSIK